MNLSTYFRASSHSYPLSSICMCFINSAWTKAPIVLSPLSNHASTISHQCILIFVFYHCSSICMCSLNSAWTRAPVVSSPSSNHASTISHHIHIALCFPPYIYSSIYMYSLNSALTRAQAQCTESCFHCAHCMCIINSAWNKVTLYQAHCRIMLLWLAINTYRSLFCTIVCATLGICFCVLSIT